MLRKGSALYYYSKGEEDQLFFFNGQLTCFKWFPQHSLHFDKIATTSLLQQKAKACGLIATGLPIIKGRILKKYLLNEVQQVSYYCEFVAGWQSYICFIYFHCI